MIDRKALRLARTATVLYFNGISALEAIEAARQAHGC